jgi:Zn ribbon nucleic-acid-binding protein
MGNKIDSNTVLQKFKCPKCSEIMEFECRGETRIKESICCKCGSKMTEVNLSKIDRKMKLTHWTIEDNKDNLLSRKFLDFNKRIKTMGEHIIAMKPTGFWLSVNNSWENWTDGNWDSWNKNKIKLNAELSNDINLFIIDSKEKFLEEFKLLTGKEYNAILYHEIVKFHLELMKKYDGIWLKSEPFYRHRMDMDCMYFYSWDCESICVWNTEKINFTDKNGRKIYFN